MSAYECVVSHDGESIDSQLAITCDGIEAVQGGRFRVSFADLMDMRLLNYRLCLTLRGGEAQITQLGYQTEDFFEQLWLAFAAKSRDALFVADEPLMSCEGDYAYHEPEAQAHGIAKLEVHPECVCLYPHDVGARRIPLCFTETCEREGFSLTITLDTGEQYRIARLGRDTEGFFSRVDVCRKSYRAQWKEAHIALERNLESRLGNAAKRYSVLSRYASRVEVGLFRTDDEGFWIAALAPGRAAVELVTDEDTATYLYQFATSDDAFLLSIRHAMEAVKHNRRIIFLSNEEIGRVPLYRMSIDRSTHVQFLRSCNVGRVIHTKNWESRIAEFFA